MNMMVRLFCVLLMGVSMSSFAATTQDKYMGHTFAPGKFALGKIGVYPTDVIIINNTPDSIYVSAPSIYKDYLGGNNVYRLTSNSTILPEVILWNSTYGYFFDRYVQPHSIISFSVQRGVANTISVQYY